MPPPLDDPQAWRTQYELECGLRKAGFSNVVMEHLPTPFSVDSPAAFVEFANSPVPEKLLKNYTGSK